MNQNLKSVKLFGCLLAVLMMIVALPLVVSAEDPQYVASIGSTKYETLEEAVAEAKADDTVTLQDDVTLAASIELTDGKALNLDLNGHSIKCEVKPFWVEGGVLNISGNGTIEETGFDQYGAIYVKGSADPAAKDYSVVTVGKDVTLISGYAPIFISKNAANSACGVQVTINGKLITRNDNSGYAIYVNGLVQNTDNYPVITLNSTAVLTATGSEYSMFYAAGYAQWNINGATLISEDGAIELKAGKLNITGGTITAGAAAQTHVPNGNGTSTTGYAIALVEHPGYALPREITISGGTVNGVIALLDDDAETANNIGVLSITGGSFSSDPTAYLVTGKVAVKASSVYTVEDAKMDNIVTAPVDTTVSSDKVIVETDPSVPEKDQEAITEVVNAAANITIDSSLKEILTEAAAQTSKDEVDEEEVNNAASQLNAQAGDVTVFVEPAVKVELTAAKAETIEQKTVVTELTFSITPVIRQTVSTASTAEEITVSNSVVLSEKEVNVVEPIIITIPLPEGFYYDAAIGLQIRHEKANGDVYFYDAIVAGEGESRTASFTVTHGFSGFTASSKDIAKVTVTFSDNVLAAEYTNLNVGAALPVPAEGIGAHFTGWSFTGVPGTYTVFSEALWQALRTSATASAQAIFSYDAADYSKVNAAVEKANGLNSYYYVDFSAVTAAVNAVVPGKFLAEQASVNAMADAIEDAISKLAFKPADYTMVEVATIRANALDRSLYANFSVVNNALNAIVLGKNITEQAAVNAMAKAINDAIDALIPLQTILGADYTAVNAAITKANSLNPADYKDFSAVNAAVKAVVFGKYSSEQEAVNAMAKAINDAIDALIPLSTKDSADYTVVTIAIAKANSLNPSDYEDFSGVTAAINAVVLGKDISEQAAVNDMANAIYSAISNLVAKAKPADYTAVNAAIARANALSRSEYEDFSAVDAAIQAVVTGKDISEQAAVDAMANAINAAINSLKGTSSSPNTGDNTRVIVWIAVSLTALAGITVFCFKKKLAR